MEIYLNKKGKVVIDQFRQIDVFLHCLSDLTKVEL